VFAVVVQLGVEFGEQTVHAYDRAQAAEVCEAARKYPALVLEAHSTDYQEGPALRKMVEDGVGVLKVGPALTFAMRESLFALECIEQELAGNRPGPPSELRSTLEHSMLENPGHWRRYATSDDRLARRYSLHDRCRYYWGVPEVDAAVRRLIGNLRGAVVPRAVLSQFCPAAYEKVRRGELQWDPEVIVRDRIRDVLKVYWQATGSQT
jgi:D-tagatose-1,6-bisphosphate aldolase subunit GatZ/KbaZ